MEQQQSTKNSFGAVVVAVVITALVMGGVWYWTEATPVSSTPETSTVTTNTDTSDDLYISKNLDYNLKIPEKWKEYNYTVEYKYITKGQDEYGVERWEETFYADFSDWPKFELLTIGSAPSMIYYATKRNEEEAAKTGEFEGSYTSPAYFWGEKIGENDTHVFYSYAIRQDAPQKFLEDDGPMPDMKKDFKITK